jgi:hypothetical protein
LGGRGGGGGLTCVFSFFFLGIVMQFLSGAVSKTAKNLTLQI